MISVNQYILKNKEPIYGSIDKVEVNLMALFYQNMIINSYFDLKTCQTDEARKYALALLYWGVSRLIFYLEGSFNPDKPDRAKTLNYFLNIAEVEKRIIILTENSNSWLLLQKEYDTLNVLDALDSMLGYMQNICFLCNTTIEHVLELSLELMGKQWSLDKVDVSVELRRLYEIRKKFLSMEAEDVLLNAKDLFRILPSLRPKQKKRFTVNIPKEKNTQKIQEANIGHGLKTKTNKRKEKEVDGIKENHS